LPDADAYWKLDRELALSAKNGSKAHSNARHEAAIRLLR
jgi:hypothetical protein